MAAEDQSRWDTKYSGKESAVELSPNAWLIQHIADLPKGQALDLATGLGHSAIDLARRGWTVTAIDISPIGLRRAAATAQRYQADVHWIAADLDRYPPPRNRFDLVTVFYYLDRVQLPQQIQHALRVGGMLVYETFTLDQLQVPNNHLTNPAHLLEPGELLTMFTGLRVRRYRDVILPDRAVASLVAEKIADR